MKCLVTKLKEGINKAGLPVLNMDTHFEDLNLIKTYVANATTGLITHDPDWIWLAGVETPIRNDGDIIGVKMPTFPSGTVRVVAIYCFSEYDDTQDIHTLNTDYGEGGRVVLMLSSAVAHDYIRIGADVKYITVRVTGEENTDIGDFITANTILQLEKLDVDNV